MYMKDKRNSSDFVLLADMHTDGVHFNPDLMDAWKDEKPENAENH